MLRALVGTLLAALLLPAAALADHGIAEALRSSGQPAASPAAEPQPGGGGLAPRFGAPPARSSRSATARCATAG